MYVSEQIYQSPLGGHPGIKASFRKRFRKWVMGYGYRKQSIVFAKKGHFFARQEERISHQLLLEKLLRYVKTMKINDLEYQLVIKDDYRYGPYIEFELL